MIGAVGYLVGALALGACTFGAIRALVRLKRKGYPFGRWPSPMIAIMAVWFAVLTALCAVNVITGFGRA